MKRDRFVVLVIACVCAISFLALLDVTRPSDPSWISHPWALQFPPYFGRDYIPIDESFLDGVTWVFVLSFLALIASAFWFTWVWLRQKVADRRLSQQVKEMR